MAFFFYAYIAKWDFLLQVKKLCIELGINFGAGDTEFIHLSDGTGCCNGSGFFLESDLIDNILGYFL